MTELGRWFGKKSKIRRFKDFLSSAKKSGFPFFGEAFEEVGIFLELNGTMHEINS